MLLVLVMLILVVVLVVGHGEGHSTSRGRCSDVLGDTQTAEEDGAVFAEALDQGLEW